MAQATPIPPKPDRSDGSLVPSEQGSARDLAHDFNNVLTVITGNLALAERHAAGNPKLLRLLNNMRAAAERGAGLTQQMMASEVGKGSFAGFSEEPAGFGGPPTTRQILVVEDDPLVAEVAVAVLQDMGYVVVLRQDAPSALTLLREGGAFDLVFSDIVMPGGMSGIELADQIAESFPKLPILLATGYSNAALAPGALRFPVLAKPYSVQELSRRVALMLPR
jgi:CheY-like chemotaxis protein